MPAQDAIIVAENVSKSVFISDQEIKILEHVSLSISRNVTCAITGISGSGKSTLLGLLAGLDQVTEGHILINGIDITALNEDERSEVRKHFIGYVFQNFELIDYLTALENIMLPLEIKKNKSAKAMSLDMLKKVGLEHRLHHYPVTLSGGEQQRVGIARAFVVEPKILLLDEPTGNLDKKTSTQIVELLFSLQKQYGVTLVVVTHDETIANRCQYLYELDGGTIKVTQSG